MFWDIFCGVLLAGCFLVFCAWLYRRLLFPMPMSGVYVLRPSGQQARVLEHQLRCCRFLRQMGLLRARVVVVADELLPQQAAALQAIARQALADEIVCLEDLRTRMAEELK